MSSFDTAAPAKKSVLPVFINGRFLTQMPITGVQRFARETLLELDRALAETPSHEALAAFTLLAPAGAKLPKLQRITSRVVGRRQGHAWEQLDLFAESRSGTLINFGFTGPLLHSRQIITIHDAGVVRTPTAYSSTFRLLYRHLVKALAARAKRVMAVSAFSASEAEQCFATGRSKIVVTTEGWQHLNKLQPDKSILSKLEVEQNSYLLAVSSNSPHKNFAKLIEALNTLGSRAPKCVIAGKPDAAIFRSTTLELNQRIIHAGYVSDEALLTLYRGAAAFVFPSLYEGFGIPPLEAMSQGCPVIAADIPPVREVCSDAAAYFDPYSTTSIAHAIAAVMADATRRAEMTKRGTERLSNFSWRETASSYIAAVHSIQPQQ